MIEEVLKTRQRYKYLDFVKLVSTNLLRERKNSNRCESFVLVIALSFLSQNCAN